MSETKCVLFGFERVGMMNILLGWTGFVMMNERVMGGCVFSCGIHMGTNMRFRYYTPQLILVFWCFHMMYSLPDFQ